MSYADRLALMPDWLAIWDIAVLVGGICFAMWALYGRHR